MTKKLFCGFFLLLITQLSYSYYGSCEDILMDLKLFCGNGASGDSECQALAKAASSCPSNNLGQLPTIKVEAIRPSPFPNFPEGGGSSPGGSGGNSGSGDREVIFPNSTQTECSTDTTANPIVIANGKKIQQEQDFLGSGEMPLAFVRYYDSFASGSANFSANGKWRHNFDYRLANDAQGRKIRKLPNGENYYFNELMLLQGTRTEINVILPDGGVETYTLDGRLLRKKNAHNVGWVLSYDEKQRLIKVTH
ncbi:DUF6531 domain-containing protein, partial [Acinetobacter bereziniae]|nr:RHS repeat protein [Acinetobacter bereziniae]